MNDTTKCPDPRRTRREDDVVNKSLAAAATGAIAALPTRNPRLVNQAALTLGVGVAVLERTLNR